MNGPPLPPLPDWARRARGIAALAIIGRIHEALDETLNRELAELAVTLSAQDRTGEWIPESINKLEARDQLAQFEPLMRELWP